MEQISLSEELSSLFVNYKKGLFSICNWPHQTYHRKLRNPDQISNIEMDCILTFAMDLICTTIDRHSLHYHDLTKPFTSREQMPLRGNYLEIINKEFQEIQTVVISAMKYRNDNEDSMRLFIALYHPKTMGIETRNKVLYDPVIRRLKVLRNRIDKTKTETKEKFK